MARDDAIQLSIAASLHRGAYVTLQALRGRPVARYMRRLRAWEQLHRNEFEVVTRALLADTLQYAYETVPLYTSGRWREVFRRSDPRHIESWPVLERQMLRTQAMDLVSRRKPLGTFYRRSSASTGEPVRVAWSPHGAAIGWANEHQAMLWHGIPPGVETLLFWGYGNQVVNWVRNYKVFRTTQLTPEALRLGRSAVFDALASFAGLADRWTRHLSGSCEVGGLPTRILASRLGRWISG